MTAVVDSSTTEPSKVENGIGNEAEKAKAEEAAQDVPSPKKKVPPKVRKSNWEQDVVYLYQFPRAPTIPSVSAYCLKVENYLRMTEIKYENVAHGVRWTSSRGNIPFIEINGTEVSDSDAIIRDLNSRFDKNLNEGLTPDQRIFTHALESMLNNQTSWLYRVWRYRYPSEFIESSQIDLKKTLGSKLPISLLNFLFKLGLKRNMVGGVDGRSGVKNSRGEIIEMIKNDLKILSEFLGSNEYFFGKEPHQLDSVAFAHVAQFLFVPIADIKTWMEEETPNLIALVNRIKDKYWPDWDQITSTLELNTHLPKKELTPEEIEAQKKEEEKKAEELKKAEEKKAEELKKKEEKQKEKEEKKRLKEEEKAKAKEEKERKKKEAAEAKAKAAAEKAEKEKAEKEKKEAEAKEKAEKEAAEKAAAEAAKPAAEETGTEGKEESTPAAPAEEASTPAAN